jgi:hypothetical protein
MFFTLSGAAVSHAIAGDSPEHILAPIVLVVPVMTSWVLQPVREGGRRRPEGR